MDRRQFLQSALYSGLLYGTGALPTSVNEAAAAFEPLQNRVLVKLFLRGGPDFRHLIVPAYDSNPNSFGYKYWRYRWRSHSLTSNSASWQQRWNDDYYPITVGGSGWNAGLADHANLNGGVTFGIWKEAGWLIDMFRAGHVALVCNAAGSRNRAHDLSITQMSQGNLFSGVADTGRSGWGGRLARSSAGNVISVTTAPQPFCFGPVGAAPNYNPNAIDNRDLIAVKNSREFGLNDMALDESHYNRPNLRMAGALRNYYQALRAEDIGQSYQRFMDHEQKLRLFGQLIRDRLSDLPEPDLIQALNFPISIDGQPVNPDAGGSPRNVVRNRNFGSQIRNLYDVCAANDLLSLRVVSMEYGGWDTHAIQRQNADEEDVNDPGVFRGIETGLKDIFGGQFGNSPSDPEAWHSGFSALWQTLDQVDRDKLVITVAGEFGRQIRDNGDRGTDHGVGNIIMVISENVNGGIYGELFPDSEIDKYDDASLRTPDIDARTDIDPLFARVCDWVEPGTGSTVFPRTAGDFTGEAPLIESAGMFTNLFS